MSMDTTTASSVSAVTRMEEGSPGCINPATVLPCVYGAIPRHDWSESCHRQQQRVRRAVLQRKHVMGSLPHTQMIVRSSTAAPWVDVCPNANKSQVARGVASVTAPATDECR